MKWLPDRAVLLGFLFCVTQILIATNLAPHSPGKTIWASFQSGQSGQSSYFRLNQWDSAHYEDISENGYHMPASAPVSMDVHRGAANVAYFPAYPLLVRFVQNTCGITTQLALLLVAHFFCWMAWTYFFLIMLEFENVSLRKALFAGFTVAVHPAAFFLVSGYSESLFIATMLGFIYWNERWKTKDGGSLCWIFAAAHGVVMTGIRLFGLAVALYPIIYVIREIREIKKSSLSAIALCVTSCAGCLLFFIWSQYKFHHWDLYFSMQQLGWGNHPDYFAILKPASYLPHFFFEDTADSISRTSIPFTAWLLVLFGINYFGKKEGTLNKRYLSLGIVALLLFYLPLAGKARANMDSMIRYTFPAFLLLIIPLVSMLDFAWNKSQRNTTKGNMAKRWVTTRKIGLVLLYIIALATQFYAMYRFLRGGWVA